MLRFTVTVTTALACAVFVFAQHNADNLAVVMPECARLAYSASIVAAGCGTDDFACQCGSKMAEIRANSYSDIVTACGSSRAADAFNALGATCKSITNVTATQSSSSTSTASQSSSTTFEKPAATRTLGSLTASSPAATFSAGRSNRQPKAGGSLSTGAKAGIAVGATGGVLFLGSVVFFLCRRRVRRSATLRVPGRVTSNDEVEKAELAGTDVEGRSRFDLAPKPELPAYQTDKRSSPSVHVAELEHLEHVDVLSELDDHRNLSERRSGLGNSTVIDGENTKTMSLKNSPPPSPERSGSAPTLAGPLPAASDLYPTPQTNEVAAEEETDFEYQARRLQERRAIIAERERLTEEKEQIAMEEEALRRKKAAKGR